MKTPQQTVKLSKLMKPFKILPQKTQQIHTFPLCKSYTTVLSLPPQTCTGTSARAFTLTDTPTNSKGRADTMMETSPKMSGSVKPGFEQNQPVDSGPETLEEFLTDLEQLKSTFSEEDEGSIHVTAHVY